METITEIAFTAEERATGVPHWDRVAAGATALRAQGCVLLRDVYSSDFIATLREAVFAQHRNLSKGAAPDEKGEVGGRRFLTPLAISGPFHAPEVYANPLALPILRAVLGDDMVLGAFNAVTSLPGAPIQHLHRDGPVLFNKAVNRLITAHAISFFVPLIEFNECTGTTRLYPGTHLDIDADLATASHIDPIVPVGSCLLLDFRLFHRGLENRSDQVRPLLTVIYQKPWFKDYKNHRSLSLLRISDEEYERIPVEHRNLLAWTEHYRGGLY